MVYAPAATSEIWALMLCASDAPDSASKAFSEAPSSTLRAIRSSNSATALGKIERPCLQRNVSTQCTRQLCRDELIQQASHHQSAATWLRSADVNRGMTTVNPMTTMLATSTTDRSEAATATSTRTFNRTHRRQTRAA
jgi:hypothetical protein